MKNSTPTRFTYALSPVQQRTVRRVLATAMLIGVTACASIPEDKQIMPQQDVARLQVAADIQLAHEGWPAASWWLQYHDAQLNHLMEQALATSPSLVVAESRIGAARAVLAFNGADRGLSTSLNANDNRQRYSANGLFPPPIGGNYFNETTVQLQTHYDFDWWHKHESQIAAALGEVNARRADFAQAEQALAVSVVQTYLQMQSAWEELAYLRQRIDKQTALINNKQKRISHGLATVDEQRQEEMNLTLLQQQSTQLQNQVQQQREALRALVGADNRALMDLTPVALPDTVATLPADIGADLLAHRADLQAARWRVQASLSKVEVAQAAFYPEINLNAAIGLDALSVSDLLKSGSLTTYLGPTLTLPLFDSKRLDARLTAARNDRNQMIAEYNQQVIDAMRDVAQSALAARSLETQRHQQQQQLRQSEQIWQSVRERYQHGLTDQATYVAAELHVLQQRQTLAQLTHQQRQAKVSLIKNLGGGFQSPPLDQEIKTATRAASSTLSSQ